MKTRIRTYPEFTDEQKKVIKSNQEKLSLNELAALLEINYTNLSGGLRQHKISFKPKQVHRKKVFQIKSSMNSGVNEEGEEIVTDEMMRQWSYTAIQDII